MQRQLVVAINLNGIRFVLTITQAKHTQNLHTQKHTHTVEHQILLGCLDYIGLCT